MRNFIKLTSVILFSCSPTLIFSQEKTKEIDTRIDNWRYWQEKAEQGIIEFNPEFKTKPPVIQYDIMSEAKSGAINTPDVLIVSGTGMNQSENSVFVNPMNNQISLNGNNSFLGVVSPAGANAMFTFDGGLTWTGGPSAPLSGNMGDPAMAIGLDGNSYAGHIASGFNQGVNISPDNGTTWSSSTVASGLGLLDKNHLWIDNSPSSPHEGNLYSAWTQFGGPAAGQSEVSITRSTDNGTTWSTPIVVSTGVSAGNLNQGVHIQTGPNGEVYVVWAIYDGSVNAGENAIGFCMSTDGGLTYTPAVRIHSSIRGIRGNAGTNPTGKNQRVNSFPVMACDISGGANNGDLYVTWSNVGVPGVNTGTDVSVYMMRSTDGGTTWGTPTRVNQDPVGNIQYFPWIASDPETGDLHTIFYDDRNVGAAMVETWVASSSDGGVTWTDFRVSDVAFTPAPIPSMAGGYMGDYLGIAARGGMVYPVWTDNRTGQTLSYTSPFSCCAANLIVATNVASGDVDQREAEFTITAFNEIASGAQGVYHAGDEVLMTDGFTSLNGSVYRAYIEGCSGSFVQSPAGGSDEEVEEAEDVEYVKSPTPKMLDYYKEKENTISLNVFPNPTSDIFSIQLTNEGVINDFTVKIYSMSQGLMFAEQFTDRNTNSFQVDISEFAAGVYIIELTDTENQKIYNGKVIKK